MKRGEENGSAHRGQLQSGEGDTGESSLPVSQKNTILQNAWGKVTDFGRTRNNTLTGESHYSTITSGKHRKGMSEKVA